MAAELVASGRPGPYRLLSYVRGSVRRLLRRRKVVVLALLRAHFDSKFYCDRYPDVRQSGKDPALHYYRWGAAEGGNPTSYLDTRAYVAEAADRIAAGMNPFQHFLQAFGSMERAGPARPMISRAKLLGAMAENG